MRVPPRSAVVAPNQEAVQAAAGFVAKYQQYRILANHDELGQWWRE
jgi:hypothetical protein